MLTEQHRAVLRVILAHQREHQGVTPTFRQIGAGAGIRSTSGVSNALQALEDEGCILRLHRRHQAIEVLPLGHWMLREAA